MKTKSIGFIGGGRITNVFLQGFQNKNLNFRSIKVCDTNSEVLIGLKKRFPEIETTTILDDVLNQEIIFLALHPPVIAENITQLKGQVNSDAIIISLAPKFTMDKINELTGLNKVARIIPNATSFINQGYNPVCFSQFIGSEEKTSIIDTLRVLGITFETEESKLEAFAITSAMLPTYFWFQWKEMEKIAVGIGLSEQESKEAIYQTLQASLNIMYKSDMNYEEMVDLIPIKPIGASEDEIKEILNSNLKSLFNKIKPQQLINH